jgi:hypothetical protein
MPPPRLREGDFRVVEAAHDPAQEIGGRNEIRVEDGDERSPGPLETVGEGAGLEALSRPAPQVRDRDPLSPESSSAWTSRRSRGQSIAQTASMTRSAT